MILGINHIELKSTFHASLKIGSLDLNFVGDINRIS